MNQNLGDLDVAEMPLPKDVASAAKVSPKKAPAPGELGRHLDQSAILLDIDGTLLDLAPTPREVWCRRALQKASTACWCGPPGRWRSSAAVRSTITI